VSDRYKNRLLLAGASAAVLTLAVASAASAAPLLLGPAGTGGTVTNTGFANFVVVDSYVLTGDLVNGPTGIIGSGTQPIAISIQNNAQITGSLINNAGGQIIAENVGILVNQADVPFIVNDGLIQVGPGAPVSDFGFAAGVIYFSAEDQTTITNNGDLNVDAIGSETGVATADATAIGIGAGQILFGSTGSSISATLTNTADFDISVLAQTTSTSNDAFSLGVGVGGAQVVIAGAGQAANLQINNSGAYDVDVDAIANGAEDGTAIAVAIGNVQVGVAETATVGLTNSGAYTVSGSAVANGGDDSALAVGVAVGAVQVGFGDSVAVSLTNTASGTFSVVASAEANANTAAQTSDTATAVAIGVGAAQVAIGDVASASLTNAGTFSLDVSATAGDAAVSGDAHAIAGFGLAPAVLQFVVASGGTVGDDATATVTNDGTLTYNISASASADNASAQAAGLGIGQIAIGGQNVTASVVNTTSILGDIGAIANGGTTVFASADGFMIGQSANGAPVTGDISAIVDNSGTIALTVHATASDASAAFASAFGQGIHQFVSGGDNASTLIVNTSTLSLDLTVLTSASGSNAYSHAVAGDSEGEGGEGEGEGSNTVTVTDGFAPASFGSLGAVHVQTANSPGATSVTNTISNSGAINIHAIANAVAANNATASATADGFSQIAFGGITTDNTITNSGTLSTIVVSAEANATGAFASANALVYGAWQDADDNGEGSASSTLTNEGSIIIVADAEANATTLSAFAGATAGYAVDQHVTGADTAAASIVNSGSISLIATAEAISTTDDARASASVVRGLAQFATATAADGIATSDITNSGSILIVAQAHAVAASEDAFASAHVSTAITQFATATGVTGSALVSIENTSSGVLTVAANATATASTSATAVATFGNGVLQVAEGGLTAGVDLSNSGSISLVANAEANGFDAEAVARFNGAAISQYASATGVGSEATASLTNSASAFLVIGADAQASGEFASASAYVGTGIFQETEIAETSGVTLTNAGSLVILANAVASDAVSGNVAEAGAEVAGAVVQVGSADGSLASVATATLTNTGTIAIQAEANATALGGSAAAEALAGGIGQAAYNAADASTLISNSGTISVSASAIAHGDGLAQAQALAGGAQQEGSATALGLVTTSFVNSASGVFAVSADATAVADDLVASVGGALAGAIGLRQDLTGTGTAGTASFANAGIFSVDASASADALNGVALAAAAGYSVAGTDIAGDDILLAVTNSGTLSVSAFAAAPDIAGALANGIVVSAAGVSGNVANSSFNSLHVTAEAIGDIANASAFGITVTSDVNTATITNTGLIDVRAIVTDTGGAFPADSTATATAIRLETGAGILVPAIGDTAFIVNDGGIIRSSVSVDGGLTFTRGTAIDVQNAPNPVEIDLKGTSADGYIYGNIEIGADDAIVVSNGETEFNGTVNSDGVLEGSLDIVTGGTLFLNNYPTTDGPSFVNVDDLNIQGTLALRLPVTNDTPAGTEPAYSQIVTNTANITGGTIEIRPDSVNGLYGDSYFYDNVIDATSLTGTFANEVLNANTPLLALDVIYDANDNVDIGITRIGFGDVAGLTINQTSTGNGIEAVYDPNYVAGPFHNLLATLFTLNFAQYTNALDQLAGAEYANYLQALQNSGRQFEGIITDRLDCAEDYKAGTPSSCHVPGEFSMWARATYSDGDHDGDVEAPAYKSDQYLFAIGGDYAVNSNFVIGGAIGAGGLDMKFSKTGARIDTDGYQAGLYASYDTGAWYLRGIGSYASYDGDSRRLIDIGNIAGINRGSPGGDVWSFYGEGGYRWGMVTPFIGLGYTSADLDSWTEKGTGTADIGATSLKVRGGSAESTYTNVGVRWIGSFGDNLTPDVRLSWRHDFGDERATYETGFAVAPGSEFSIISAEQDPDSAVLGIGLTGNVGGGMKVKFGYDGLFNSSVNVNSVSLKLTYTLGGNN
jgi:uncharacterized protein with beta-barrel porin domain